MDFLPVAPGFLIFLTMIIVLPVACGLAALRLKSPGSAAQFGTPPQGKSIASAVLTVYRKTVVWRGRASRSEFWWYMVFVLTVQNTIVGLIALRDGEIDTNLMWLAQALFLPTGLAAGTRRLHDIGRSGWWQLLALTGTGYLLLLVLWALPTPKEKDVSVVEVFE